MIDVIYLRLAAPEQRDAFGIIVSYAIKVKLFLGALGGKEQLNFLACSIHC